MDGLGFAFGAAFGGRAGTLKACSRRRSVVVNDVGALRRKPIPFPGDEAAVEEAATEYGLRPVTLDRVVVAKPSVVPVEEEQDNGVSPQQKSRSETRDMNYVLKPGEVAVRFVNTPFRKDIIVPTRPGKNLMKLGDSVEIKIPRGCQTGLCGACTVDLEDPGFPGGVQTVRACQTQVLVPEGCDEMVVDLHRMEPQREFSRKNPFERFDDIDTKYNARAPPRSWGERTKTIVCATCDGTGKHLCPECDGEGVLESNKNQVCYVCMGRGYVTCADCQGTGERKVRR